jgi:hypothetical protein
LTNPGGGGVTLARWRIVAKAKEPTMGQQDFVLDIEELAEVTEEENASAAFLAPTVAEAVIDVVPPF